MLPDVYEEQYFSNVEIVSASNVYSLVSINVFYNTTEINVGNILEMVNVIINYGNVTPEAGNVAVLFEGTYSNIFLDKFIQYRDTGKDPNVYRVFSFSQVPDALYALTRYRPDLRNALNVNYKFSAEVSDPESNATVNANIVVSQTVLNDYNRGIAQMLAAIARETKIPGEV